MAEFTARGIIRPFIGEQVNVEVENGDELREFWERERIATILQDGQAQRPVITIGAQKFLAGCKVGDRVLYTIASQDRANGRGIKGVSLRVITTQRTDSVDSQAFGRPGTLDLHSARTETLRIADPIERMVVAGAQPVPPIRQADESISGWSAERFIERVLSPRTQPPWWSDLSGEVRQRQGTGRYLEDTLEAELAQDIPSYRLDSRRLLFFSADARTTIDGRADRVGVEEKYTDLTFPSIIDGAIHRSVVWVVGNPQALPAGTVEGVALCVVRRGATPMNAEVARALFPVLGSLASRSTNVVFIDETSGERWRALAGGRQLSLPPWLATSVVPERGVLPVIDGAAVVAVLMKAMTGGRSRSLFDRRQTYTEFSADGLRCAVVEWGNHWQMIEVGLLLRGAGYDAVKVVYAGSHSLRPAGRDVEAAVQQDLLRSYGVLLDWGVRL